jgi:hypothetical protein
MKNTYFDPSPAAKLCSDDIHRGSIVALRKWCNEGRYRGDWSEYRESAIAWLKESIDRLEAVESPDRRRN